MKNYISNIFSDFYYYLRTINFHVIIIFSCLFYSFNYDTFSQSIDNKIYSNWIFGKNCNINFEYEKVNNNNLYFEFNSEEGISSITNLNDNNIFCSNGIQLFDKNGIIENGDSLFGHLSSTQSNLILKVPENNNYVIFTVSNLGKQIGLNYSLIEYDNNRNKYIVKNKNKQLQQTVTERLSSTNHLNDIDKWICVKGWRNNSFYTFKLTKKGVDSIPIISQVASEVNNLTSLNTLGQMKFSPNGNLLAMATSGSNLVEIFDFDKYTGKLLLKYSFSDKRFNSPYGVEFSPDNNLLYISYQVNKSSIVQYNLKNIFKNSIENSSNIISTFDEDYYYGSLQLTPDYNICVANFDSNHLDVILLPNSIDNCKYVINGISLGKNKCQYGLPNCNSSEFLNFTNSKYSLIKDYKIEKELINIVGDAKIENENDNNLQRIMLNDNKTFQKGAFWTKNKVNIKEFDVFFKIKLSNGNNNQIIDGSPEGADGFAFVINNFSNNIIGEPAGGIGYSGIPNSLAVEFDCFKNSFEIDNINDPNGSHIAINSNGILSNNSNHNNNSTLAINDSIFKMKSMNDIYYVRIKYINNILEVYFDTLGNLKVPVLILNDFDIYKYISNLGNQDNDYKAYIGITSSTGNAVQKCEIISFTYNSESEIINNILENESNNIILDNFDVKLISNKLILKSNGLNDNLNLYQNLNFKLFDLNGKLLEQSENIKFIENQIEIQLRIFIHNGVYILNFEMIVNNKLHNFSKKIILE